MEFENELKNTEDGNKDGITIGYKIALSYVNRILDGDMRLLNSLWDRKYGKVGYTDSRGSESIFELLPLKL